MVELSSQAWLTYAEDLRFELMQCRDEGRDIKGLEEKIESILALPEDDPSRETSAASLLDESVVLPQKASFRFTEPSDLLTILESR